MVAIDASVFGWIGISTHKNASIDNCWAVALFLILLVIQLNSNSTRHVSQKALMNAFIWRNLEGREYMTMTSHGRHGMLDAR